MATLRDRADDEGDTGEDVAPLEPEVETVWRLPCGCPEIDDYLDVCPGHVFSHWHPSPIDALREDRFCFYCGEMETQRIGPGT